MEWLRAVEQLRASRERGVLVTVAAVRGHAPREAGAKMVVAAGETWGSIGGGNLEAGAIAEARAMLAPGATAPPTVTSRLTDRAPGTYGVQCCGGEVSVVLDPLPVRPSVAVFGAGHVGLELARILARHDLDLHLVHCRLDPLPDRALAPLADAEAQVHVHHVPVAAETVLAELPPGTHVVIMTHDHAEDAALCDAALRRPDLGTIGLIGSSAKWQRFRRRLAAEGHDEAALDRIVTP